ncbi:MAG: SDR family oxidoreductase [Spirochaetaceae bacterium]|nr:MAG: SDR family oxidoreductase [Spirochaetaceae bacterium]
MKVAIIGASGKTGIKLVRESLKRGYQVVAVCRTSSAERLKGFADNDKCTVVTAPVVSNPDTLTKALTGCDAVVAILISVRRLKATELVRSLAKATVANGVKRLVFSAGEVTAVPEKDETLTFRQRIMLSIFSFITLFTPFSMTDMIKSSVMLRQQPDWNWTIVRAPTLTEEPGAGYRLCEINEVTAKHAVSREDYAACMLDSLENPEHYRRTLTVVPAEG